MIYSPAAWRLGTLLGAVLRGGHLWRGHRPASGGAALRAAGEGVGEDHQLFRGVLASIVLDSIDPYILYVRTVHCIYAHDRDGVQRISTQRLKSCLMKSYVAL